MRPPAYAPTDTSKGIVLMGVMVKVCSTSFSMITVHSFRELQTLGIIFSSIPFRRLKLETTYYAHSYQKLERAAPSFRC